MRQESILEEDDSPKAKGGLSQYTDLSLSKNFAPFQMRNSLQPPPGTAAGCQTGTLSLFHPQTSAINTVSSSISNFKPIKL